MSVRDLPDVYMITNDDFEDVETLIKKVDHQLNQGIRLVQLRIKNKKMPVTISTRRNCLIYVTDIRQIWY